MNYIDIIIIVIIAFSAIFGFANGLVKEAVALAAFIIGVWGAIKFSVVMAQKLYEFFDISGQYTDIVAFIVTFVLFVIAAHFIGLIINKLVNILPLGILNMILGGVVGILKSVFLLSVLFFILNAIDVKKPFLPKEKIKQSALYNSISDIIPTLFPTIGEGTLKQNFDRFKKDANDILI